MPRTGTTNRDDPRDHYTAWQSMRPNGRGKANPPPTPGRAPTSATRDPRQEPSKKPEPSYVPPRTASQRTKAEAAFGNRKSGYVPHSPGPGDEPPVISKNYSTTRIHTNIFGQSSSSNTEEPQVQPTSTIPDPLAKFRDNYMDKRKSSPYHAFSGEKTSLHDGGPGLGRATSTRDPPRKPEMPGAFPHQRSSSAPKNPLRDTSADAGSINIDIDIDSSNDGASDASSTTVNTGIGKSAHAKAPNGNENFQSQASDNIKAKLNAQGVPNPSMFSNPPTAFTRPSKRKSTLLPKTGVVLTVYSSYDKCTTYPK